MDDGTDLLEPIAGPSTSTHALPDLLAASVDTLTGETVSTSMAILGEDEATATAFTLLRERELEDVGVAMAICDSALGRASGSARDEEKESDSDATQPARSGDTAPAFERKGTSNGASIRRVQQRNRLRHLRDRIETFQNLWPTTQARPSGTKTTPPAGETQSGTADETEQLDLDDPWAENEDRPPEVDDPWESTSVRSVRSSKSVDKAECPAVNSELELSDPPLTLSDFLSHSLPNLIVAIASSGDIRALGVVYRRFKADLWPYRYAIMDALPPFVSPVELTDVDILPKIVDGHEVVPAWAEPSSPDLEDPDVPSTTSLSTSERQSADQVRDWLLSRVNSLDPLGLLDLQLAWIQHGAALGIPDLDVIGEEISLLSRLVYDANLTPAQQSEWSLSSWRKATPEAILKAYLSNATVAGVVSDVRRLVLPYLYVLEAKAERAGREHKELVETHLHDNLLGLPLHLALPIFEASKATTSAPERIIKNDLTVARLALACLYGSNERNQWSTMSSIFECLPVWDVSGGDPESDKEATATTLDSIATFVRPTRAGAHPPTAKDLFIFFAPLPFASLSRALDILDVHLESGEILARWDTPVQLRFLLQSARNKEDQTELAEKMVRRQVGGPHTEARWTGLWADMKKLAGGDDAMLRGAFGVLSREQMVRTYLGGVLASGKFDVARKMIARLQAEEGVSDETLRHAVLQASREFYENAESGNIHTGEMKLAYDCLSVAPPSDAVTAEKDFIEATSRISTFSLKSSSGRGTLSPLEVRHAKNRLDLVKQILQTSDDAYRHPELVLDLTDKLGYRKDPAARVKILALLVEAATKGGDFDLAFEHSQEVFKLSSKRHLEADVAWRALVALGSQTDFADVTKRMTLLGQALELCPPDQVPTILSTWRRVEEGQMKLSDAAKRRRIAGIRSTTGQHTRRPTSPSSVTSASAAAEERVLGSRTAARAARLAMGFAGNRLNLRGIASSPLGPSPVMSNTGGSPRVSEDAGRTSNESDRPNFGAMFEGAGVKAGTAEAERVRQQARKALVRGVGWLLGADEKDIAEDR